MRRNSSIPPVALTSAGGSVPDQRVNRARSGTRGGRGAEGRGMRRAVRIIVVLCLLVLAAPYVLTLAYTTGHPVSTLMLARWFTGQPVTREWRDLSEIAPALARTVIAAEDAKFCSHRGIDWNSLQEAIEDAQ